MTAPTEAELFADFIEYRSVFEILSTFDLGFDVSVERLHSVRTTPDKPCYRVTIKKVGGWSVVSDSCESLPRAAEQARVFAFEEQKNEPLVEQAKAAISGIVAEQIAAELNSAIHGRLLKGRR